MINHSSYNNPNWKHGESELDIKSPEYEAWSHMMSRCYNPNSKDYRNYGARGIVVCDSWVKNLVNFIDDIGRRPTPKHTLGRKDNNGNYEPSNCEWQTRTKQARNRRTNRLTLSEAREVRMLYNHRGYSQRELAREFGVHQSTIWRIIHKTIWKENR